MARPKTAALLLMMLVGLLIINDPAGASAVKTNYFEDFYNGVQQFSELPSEVNKLQQSYKESLESLEQANAALRSYEEQNAQLLEQNRQLTETVNALQQAEQHRQKRANQFQTIILWAIGLFIGYFICIRAIRYIMKRSNRW